MTKVCAVVFLALVYFSSFAQDNPTFFINRGSRNVMHVLKYKNTIVSIGDKVIYWDSRTARELQIDDFPQGENFAVSEVKQSPGGRFLQMKSIVLDFEKRKTIKLFGALDRSTFLSFSDNGNYAYYLIEGKYNKLFRVQLESQKVDTLAYPEANVRSVPVLNHEQQYFLALSALRKTLSIVDFGNKVVRVKDFDQEVTAVQVSADNAAIYVGFKNSIQVLQFSDLSVLSTLQLSSTESVGGSSASGTIGGIVPQGNSELIVDIPYTYFTTNTWSPPPVAVRKFIRWNWKENAKKESVSIPRMTNVFVAGTKIVGSNSVHSFDTLYVLSMEALSPKIIPFVPEKNEEKVSRKIRLSFDGEEIYVFNESNTVYRIRTRSGNYLKPLKGTAAWISSVHIDHKNTLSICDQNFSFLKRIRLSDFQEVNLYGGIGSTARPSTDLQSLLLVDNSFVSVWDLQRDSLLYRKRSLGLDPYLYDVFLRVSADRKSSVHKSGDQGFRMLDFKSGKYTSVDSLFGVAPKQVSLISKSNKYFLATQSDGSFDVMNRSKVSLGKYSLYHGCNSFSNNDTYFASAKLFSSSVSVLNLKTNAKRILRVSTGEQLIEPLIFSNNNRYLTAIQQNFVRIFDLNDARDTEYKAFALPDSKLFRVEFSSDYKQVIGIGSDFSDKNLIQFWDLASGKLQTVLRQTPLDPSFTADYKYFAGTSGGDNLAGELWNQNGKIVNFVVSNDGKDFITYTPDNYYMASKGSNQFVHFVKNQKVYFFDQFDLQFNRPDIILQRTGLASEELINSYKRAYEKRIKRLGFSPESMSAVGYNAPELRIEGSDDANFQTTSPSLLLKIEAEDKLSKLDRLQVRVNGVPEFGMKGKDLSALNSQKWKGEITVNLSSGTNIVEVSVLNAQGTESLKERMDVIYNNSVVKRTLHLVVVGVSEYKQSEKNLQYASKDGQDLIKFFDSEKRNAEFGQVRVHSLQNAEATKENILALKDKLMSSSVDDVVVFFFSGHGLLDSSLDYYLATHDINFMEPSTKGLAFETLEHILDGIPARQKLLFIDACHSGEIDKEETVLVSTNQKTEDGDLTFRSAGGMAQQKHLGLSNSMDLSKYLFADLRKSSGATIISAAGGMEYAIEGTEWKNGVFTYSLLSGLKSGKADLDKDGKVMMSELQRYLFTTVPEITKGRQQPTSRVENIYNDFRIW